MYYFLERYRLVIYAIIVVISGLWLLLNNNSSSFWNGFMQGAFIGSATLGTYFLVDKFLKRNRQKKVQE